MSEFKIGDKIRLTGSYWDMGPEGPQVGDIVTIKNFDHEGDPVFTTGDGDKWVVMDEWYGGELVDAAPTEFADKVHSILADLEKILVSKNESYGNSALEPVRIFSKVDDTEGIRVRIDDKLSRIAKGNSYGEDAVTDLIGYLVLLKISEEGK